MFCKSSPLPVLWPSEKPGVVLKDSSTPLPVNNPLAEVGFAKRVVVLARVSRDGPHCPSPKHRNPPMYHIMLLFRRKKHNTTATLFYWNPSRDIPALFHLLSHYFIWDFRLKGFTPSLTVVKSDEMETQKAFWVLKRNSHDVLYYQNQILSLIQWSTSGMCSLNHTSILMTYWLTYNCVCLSLIHFSH